MTGFSSWLLRQVGRNDPIGDVAREAKADPEFPRTGSVENIEAYVSLHGCSGAVEALRKAIREWAGQVPE
jgi:hypothetical protein